MSDELLDALEILKGRCEAFGDAEPNDLSRAAITSALVSALATGMDHEDDYVSIASALTLYAVSQFAGEGQATEQVMRSLITSGLTLVEMLANR